MSGVLGAMKAIAGTGVLVAFGNRRDAHHEWAPGLARQVVEPLLTREAVLAESIFHLGDAQPVLDCVRTGLEQPAFSLADHIPRIAELAASMSELHPRHVRIATDAADFRVYRRNRRQTIPLICPAAR